MGTINSTKNIVNKVKNETIVAEPSGITSGADLSKTMSTVNNAFVKKQTTNQVSHVNIKKSIKNNNESKRTSTK